MQIDWYTFQTVRQKPQYRYTKLQKIKPTGMTRVPFEALGESLLFLDVEPFGRMSFKNLPYIRELSYILVQNGQIIKESTTYKTRPCIEELYLIVSQYQPTLIAHNGLFYDYPIILAHAAHYGLLEPFKTVKFADSFIAAKRSKIITRNYSNSAIYNHTFGTEQSFGKLHNARVDVLVLMSWYLHLKLPMYCYDFDKLVSYQQKSQLGPSTPVTK